MRTGLVGRNSTRNGLSPPCRLNNLVELRIQQLLNCNMQGKGRCGIMNEHRLLEGPQETMYAKK